MLFIKVYGQFPETSEKLAFLASQKKHVLITVRLSLLLLLNFLVLLPLTQLSLFILPPLSPVIQSLKFEFYLHLNLRPFYYPPPSLQIIHSFPV